MSTIYTFKAHGVIVTGDLLVYSVITNRVSALHYLPVPDKHMIIGYAASDTMTDGYVDVIIKTDFNVYGVVTGNNTTVDITVEDKVIEEDTSIDYNTTERIDEDYRSIEI